MLATLAWLETTGPAAEQNPAYSASVKRPIGAFFILFVICARMRMHVNILNLVQVDARIQLGRG